MNARPRILIVDDEPPARARLKALLSDIAGEFPHELVGEADNGLAALERLAALSVPVDIVLADIAMPEMGGLELAQQLAGLPQAPAVVFVTAHDEFALKAFELSAADYLMKPVRAERLLEALRKARRLASADFAALAAPQRTRLRVVERGQVILVPIDAVLYLRAELKYVTARTPERAYLLEESLAHLEAEFAARFVRIHRNCLVAVAAVAGAARVENAHGEAHWELSLKGVTERLTVSRRQWPQVKTRLGL
ncbi:MAG: LytTR family DNA-binding domain-containing protein [Rhodocyclaceae bacterium]|nr:LytTR family DNA-binding domain-containing protein [Rhodocyclaceae bacterium]